MGNNQVICFKRWTNKGYASFISMCRVVRIGVLSLGCSLLILPGVKTFASTANDTARNLTLKEIEVTAQREVLHEEMARIVTVVPRELIAQAPVATIGDLLRFVSGIDLRQRGGNGAQADISMRGGSFDQMQVLLNGVNFSDPQTGHYSLDLPIDLSQIDRIEVLQGPNSRNLGPNAFSGAINIITGTKSQSEASLSYTGGDHGLSHPQGAFTLKSEKTTLFAASSFSHSDGYTSNTDYDIFNLMAQVRHASRWCGDLNFQVGFQDKGFGALQFYSLAYPDQYEKTSSLLSSLSTTYKLGHFTISPKIYWRQHLDRFELFRYPDQQASWYKHANYHQTDLAGTELTGNYYSSFGKTSLGVSYRMEHIYSNVLGNPRDSFSVWFADNEPDVFFDHEKTRHNFNAFFEQSLSLEKITASTGAAVTYSNDFGAHYTFGADFSYEPTKGMRIFSSVNNALRLPTFTDLYYSSKTQIPNPDLHPEKATTYELGIKYNHSFAAFLFQSGASGFFRHGKDIIDWIKFPGEETWRSMNHTDINALGCNLWVELSTPYHWLRYMRISYDFTSLDKNANGYLSQYALDYLKHKVALSTSHLIFGSPQRQTGALEALWLVTFNARHGYYTNANKELVDYDPFALVNLRLAWNKAFHDGLKSLTLFVDANNLLDTSFYDYGGIQQPGIWLKGGASFKF